MTEITRKLATVRRIAEIKPIEGADRIEAYRVDGWWVVSQKDVAKVGDLVLYCEIDSFLPVREEFEFLRKGCFKSTKNLGDGFRLRTIKLKGAISQGLILPLTDFSEIQKMADLYVTVGVEGTYSLNEGDDLTDLLGIQKYEKPIPSNLQGIMRGNFPSFIPKTDQERYQNIRKWELEVYKDVPFEITIKMDGTSMTVYYKDGYFGVCSRNMDLQNDAENNFKAEGGSENIYWKVARRHDIANAALSVGFNFAIQGELCGPGIQGNPHNLKDHEFFVFDIWNINEQRYLTPFERTIFLSRESFRHIGIVPLNFVGTLGKMLLDDDFIHEMADNSTYCGQPAEGLVFKANDGKFSFKMISDKYLINEKD